MPLRVLVLLIASTAIKVCYASNMEITLTSFQAKLPLVQNQPLDCSRYNTQLANLFDVMCGNIAGQEDNVLRDACTGCFRLAITTNNNQPALVNLTNCASNYLVDTRYELCINRISNVPNFGPCVSGYCGFVQCIRRVNADLLIAQCYDQAASDNAAILEEDQVILVKNVTSCILARARCAPLNPITGRPQISRIAITTRDKWGKPTTSSVPLYNSMQITPAGDLRVIALPGTTQIQDYLCSQPNLQESSWMEYSC